MTPLERQKTQQLQRQLVGETQLADKLYAALVHGGFDHIWWAMQDYAQSRGKKAHRPPTYRTRKVTMRDNEMKMQGWRKVNCEDFFIQPPKEEDDTK